MEANSMTQLLSILLILSIITLFVLIGVLIVLTTRKKIQEKEEEEKFSKPKEEIQVKTNVIEAKTYTTGDVKKFMDFEEIKDNMIVQKNGKRLIMVIQCNGVNYDLMSSVEKVGVEQGFIQFLNSLTKPIQLHVQARKTNLEESVSNYKTRLKTIENNFNKVKVQYERAKVSTDVSEQKFKEIKLEYTKQKNLLEYTKDIIANTERMSLNKNILTKNYYIAIAHYTENTEDLLKKEELLDLAFSELYTQAQSILRTLSVCGITGKVLDSTELADLLYVAYNRDSSEIYGVDKAIKSGYDALYTTAPDVINKKIEELDKLINTRAIELANNTIEKVELKNKRQEELKRKENDMESLIKELAKSMIKENQGYISEEIMEESIKEIDNVKEKKAKKGA